MLLVHSHCFALCLRKQSTTQRLPVGKCTSSNKHLFLNFNPCIKLNTAGLRLVGGLSINNTLASLYRLSVSMTALIYP